MDFNDTYRRYSREELIDMYDMTEEQKVYFLPELERIEEYIYREYVKQQNAEEIKAKDQLFKDIWNCKCPERIPVTQGVDYIASFEYAGLSPLRDLYSVDKILEAMDKIMPEIDSDTNPIGMAVSLVSNKILQPQNHVQAKDGFMQHPNFCAMKDDEYPILVKDPQKFLDEIIDVRVNKAFHDKTPEEIEMVKLRDNVANMFYYRDLNAGLDWLNIKYARSTMNRSLGLSGAPFDMIPNSSRNFSVVLVDIRRQPENVMEAVRVFTELFKTRIDNMAPGCECGRVFMPLHLATYMKGKDFDKFYWPTLKEICEYIVASGRRFSLFCEDNWDRYVEYLNELPEESQMAFEYTDPALCVKTFGNKYSLAGFYPLDNIKSLSKEENEYEVKKFLDIVAPTQKYTFRTDKGPINLSDCNLEVMKHVIATVKEYGKY